MRIHKLHSWDLSRLDAIALQREMACRVDGQTTLGSCEIIAAADVSHGMFSNLFFAGVVVLRMKDMEIIEQQGVVQESSFPYYSGLLSFREAPALLDAFAKLKTRPDAVIIDGHGFSHPRRFGLACHIGVWLDRPTIGCAKTRLVGRYDEPGQGRGAGQPLVVGNEVIGEVVRTKPGVKPIFVSVGHLINLASAVRLILESCRGYRLPEPIRQVHQFVNTLRQKASRD